LKICAKALSILKKLFYTNQHYWKTWKIRLNGYYLAKK
jgi:hypothetical protein